MMGSKEAERLKLEGNQYFSKGYYSEAIRCYSEAIEHDSKNAILYSNRAFAHIKLKDYLRAERDCDKALDLNDTLDKAYFRRGIARKELKRFKPALEDFTAALKISPKSANIKTECESLKELIQNTKRIKLEPIEKEEEFQSKVPLRKINIEDGAADEVKGKDETSSKMFTQLRKMAISHLPKNYLEFERGWREAKTEDRLEYLERIDLASYHTIFTYPFDPQMLFEVIQALGGSTNKLLIYQIFQIITLMPRFDITIIFFGKSEKEALKEIFQKLTSLDMDREKITALAKTFDIE